MTYLQKPYKRSFSGKSVTKILFIFLSILVFIFLINSFSFGSSIVSNTLSPLFGTGGLLYKAYDGVLKSFTSNDVLLEENKSMEQRLSELEARVVDYEAIKNENSALRAELALRPKTQSVSSYVVSKPPQVPLDTLVIDKGTADGISEGYLVLGGERLLLGKVEKVSRSGATIVLNSFPGVVSYGYVGRTSEAIDIEGEGGSSMKTKVPLDFDIKLGDQIMSQGSIPHTLGIVGSVEEDKASGFKNILISLPISVSKINLIFVKLQIAE